MKFKNWHFARAKFKGSGHKKSSKINEKLCLKWLHQPFQEQDSPNLAPNCSQDASKRSNLAQKWLQKLQLSPQDAPKRRQDAPSCLQDAPRWLQDAPKMPPRGPKMPQDASKMPSRWLKMAPRCPQEATRCPKMHPRCHRENPKEALRCPNMPPDPFQMAPGFRFSTISYWIFINFMCFLDEFSLILQ